VKLVDLNVLIYASDDASAHFATARPWLDAAMSSTETIGLPAAVTVGFVRITTNARIMNAPVPVDQAIDAVRTWLARPNVTVPSPGPRHYDLIEELLLATGIGGNLVADAHLAALAIEHGATLVSYDRDFARFPGVRWESPI
jgi:toxin-antitoxin system PIN domain toxin